MIEYASACVLRSKMTCAEKLDYSEEKVRRFNCQVRSGDQDYSCSMLLYHVISTTCSHAGGWGSTALAGHSSRSMLVSTQN